MSGNFCFLCFNFIRQHTLPCPQKKNKNYLHYNSILPCYQARFPLLFRRSFPRGRERAHFRTAAGNRAYLVTERNWRKCEKNQSWLRNDYKEYQRILFFFPFPEYPGLQVHTKDPIVLLQKAFASQLCFPVSQSFISAIITKSGTESLKLI